MEKKQQNNVEDAPWPFQKSHHWVTHGEPQNCKRIGILEFKEEKEQLFDEFIVQVK